MGSAVPSAAHRVETCMYTNIYVFLHLNLVFSPSSRWSSTLSSKVNLPQAINFGAKCCANLVTRDDEPGRRIQPPTAPQILCENPFNSKKIQGDFVHFRENNQIILSKVAKIALKIVFKLKRFSHKIGIKSPSPTALICATRRRIRC